MAILVLENYLSLDEYATLCDISRRSVLNRIKSRTVSAIKVDGMYALNKETNPPRKLAHYKFSNPSNGRYSAYTALRAVIPCCNRKNIRCYPYLRAIITGKMDGWVICGEVFAKATDLKAWIK
jgi:hypothetical protein